MRCSSPMSLRRFSAGGERQRRGRLERLIVLPPIGRLFVAELAQKRRATCFVEVPPCFGIEYLAPIVAFAMPVEDVVDRVRPGPERLTTARRIVIVPGGFLHANAAVNRRRVDVTAQE